mgnify:CR=1 FL=1
MFWDSVNKELICAAAAWLAAQLIKCIICLVVNRSLPLNIIFGSGGMPSSHSATVCSLTAAVGFDCGVRSPLFGVCCILAFIVMYDAMGVRRETGEQAKVLNRMISDWLSEDEDAPAYLAQNGRKLEEKVGHTPFEVLSGALLGILIAVIVPAP